jgi:hypothetical protein
MFDVRRQAENFTCSAIRGIRPRRIAELPKVSAGGHREAWNQLVLHAGVYSRAHGRFRFGSGTRFGVPTVPKFRLLLGPISLSWAKSSPLRSRQVRRSLPRLSGLYVCVSWRYGFSL